MDCLATGTRLAAYRVPCKSWSCPKCAKRKARTLADRALKVFEKDHMRHLTLTERPGGTTPQAILRTNQAFNRLRLKITRKYGKCKYLKVLEFQKTTKMPHFHVLINKFISREWLKGAIPASGFGPVFWIEDCPTRHIFQYVVKYLRKGIPDDYCADALLRVNGRRYSFSRGCTLQPDPCPLHPFCLVKADDPDPAQGLILDMWYRFLEQGGAYPVASSQYYAEYFRPSKDLSSRLLPGMVK